jgi:hypothetical protein
MPNSISLKLQELAERLLSYETISSRSSGARAWRVFHVFEKLRQPLVPLTGVGGFRSLLSRALAIANAEIPWLSGLHVRSDGSLEGFDELGAKLSQEDIARGETELVGRFIALLVTFIGPALTLQLLQDAWPMIDEFQL